MKLLPGPFGLLRPLNQKAENVARIINPDYEGKTWLLLQNEARENYGVQWTLWDAV